MWHHAPSVGKCLTVSFNSLSTVSKVEFRNCACLSHAASGSIIPWGDVAIPAASRTRKGSNSLPVIDSPTEEPQYSRNWLCSHAVPSWLRVLCFMLFAFLCSMLLLSSVGCGKKKAPPEQPGKQVKTAIPPDAPTDASLRLNEYTIVVPPSGPRVWVAEMKSGTANSSSGVITMRGLRSILYQDGKEALEASADVATAVVKDDTVDATLSGHVLAVSKKDGQRLTAERLRWKSGETVIHVETFVFTGRAASGELYTLRAPRGTVSLDLSEINFTGGTIEMHSARR